RDLYALALLRMGRKEEGLKEVTRSVLYSPSLSTHFYLGDTLPPWLSQKEKEAVEEGFKKALASEYAGAMEGLASFYARLGRFTDEGKLYEQAALKMKDPATKAGHLLNAGLAYVKVNEGKKAEALFRQAVLTVPQDSRPYHQLALIFAARGELDAAKTVVSEGIGNGADPLSLYFSLAEAAQKAGNREEEKSALLKALDHRPSSSETVFRLGSLNLQENNFDRAALYFSKAANMNPNSAAAFYHLGLAEEGRYQFVAAGKAYARALELLPHNIEFQQRYEAFRLKVARGAKEYTGPLSR
ncbi:MAG: tetratricopeptide repeat protein, partial [Candidatus Binatia bacterium]